MSCMCDDEAMQRHEFTKNIPANHATYFQGVQAGSKCIQQMLHRSERKTTSTNSNPLPKYTAEIWAPPGGGGVFSRSHCDEALQKPYGRSYTFSSETTSSEPTAPPHTVVQLSESQVHGAPP